MEADQTMDTDTEEEIPVNMKTAAVRAGKGRQLSPRTRERLGVKGLDLRRPVRPVDREKMRPWLKNHLDSGTVFGLKWLQKEEGTFQVSWRHASRLGWKLETDGDVFEKWARHTGIYKDGDEPEPKRWKANFRCALHSLPDVKELTDPVERRGHNANRTYRFLQPHELGNHLKRKPGSAKPVVSEASPELTVTADLLGEDVEEEATVEISEDSSSQHADSDVDRTTDEEAQYREIYVIPQSDHDYAVRMGRQEGGESVTKILSEHGSGFVLIKTKKSSKLPSLPTTLAEALDISPLPERKQPVERAGPPSSAKHIKVSRRSVLPDRGKGKTQQARKKGTGSRLLTDEDGVGKTVGFSAVTGGREGEGQPSQPLGFEALLEAASMARMDTLTTSPALCGTTTPVTVAEQSACDSTVLARQPELTSAPLPSPLPSVSSSLVLSFLQNLLGSPALSTVVASPTLSLSPPTLDSPLQGQPPVPVIQAKDTSNSQVLHHCTKMTETARKAGVRGTVGCDKESSALKSLYQDRSQTVATAAGIFTSLTLPSTSAVNSSLPAVNTSLPAVNTSLPAVNTSLPAVNTSLPAVNTFLPAHSSLKPAFCTEHSAQGSESVVSGIKSESPVGSLTSVKMERLSPTKKEGEVEEKVGKWEVMDVHSVTSVKVELDCVTDMEHDRLTEFGMKGTPGTVCADYVPTSSVSKLHADSSSREQQPFAALHSNVEAAAVTADRRQCGGPVSHTLTSHTTVPGIASTSSSSPAQGVSTHSGTATGVSGNMGESVDASVGVSSNECASVDGSVEAEVGVDAPPVSMGQLLVVNPSMVVSVAQDNTPILTLSQLQQLLTLCLAQRQPVVLRAENAIQPVTENTLQPVIPDTENTLQPVNPVTENTLQPVIPVTENTLQPVIPVTENTLQPVIPDTENTARSK